MIEYTHYSASTNVGMSPLTGKIDDENLLVLANNGSTPQSDERRDALKPESDRIRAGLEAGKTVTTKTAVITPISATEYERVR